MKEYYYLTGKDQNGPFSIEELKSKKLSIETLIWTEGMSNWEKIKDVPDLFELFKISRNTPPPPPIINDNSVLLSEKPNDAFSIESIKPSTNVVYFFLVWLSFHSFALLMSYSEVYFFNNCGKPKTEKFWPFVDFLKKEYNNVYGFDKSREEIDRMMSSRISRGIFVEYDWSEFLIYVIGFVLIYLLYRLSNKEGRDVT